MQVRDAVCVVTGAASGLGAATAAHLESLGGRVAWLDARPPSTDQSEDRLVLGVDVCDERAMEDGFARIADALGPIRILVNCAGVLGPAQVAKRAKDGSYWPRDLEVFRRVIEVNLIGVFNTMRLFAAAAAALPPLADSERGVIVNTASIAAEDALSGQVAYGASKGAVAALSLPAARELASLGVRVVSISPGVFATGMYEVIPEHTRRELIADVPFPRRPGHPHEFARMVEAVISNPMLNGCNIRLDGAARMREPRTARV